MYIFDQCFCLRCGAFARDNAEDEPMGWIKGDVIPAVPPFGVSGIVGIAVFLLFPHECPFLIELHLARLGGKTPQARHADRGHGRLLADYTGGPYRGGLEPGDSFYARHSPPRRGPVLQSPLPSPAWSQTGGSLAAPRSVPYRIGSRAGANAAASHSACRCSGCQHRVSHGPGSLDCDSKTARDRPPFALHWHHTARSPLALCG